VRRNRLLEARRCVIWINDNLGKCNCFSDSASRSVSGASQKLIRYGPRRETVVPSPAVLISDNLNWGLYWVPGYAGVRGNEIADEFARGGSVLEFVRPEPALAISRQDIRRRITRWLVNQRWVRWRSLGDTQKQARELISGPCLGAKARFLSFNSTQSRAVTGLLTGHNTLRRHLHLMVPSDSPLCRRCEHRMKPRPTFFVTVNLWLHSDMCIWAPSSWSQRTSRVYVSGPSGTLAKQQGSHKLIWGTKGRVN
jgi:hypothetical protein